MTKKKTKKRIRQELLEIQKMISKTQSYIKQHKEPQTMVIVLSLYSFYTGVERIFKFIARFIDYLEPMEADWHEQLLYQMTLTIPDVRPKVISQSTQLSLDEFRRVHDVVHST